MAVGLCYRLALVLGGGFGGLYAARSLRRAPVRVTLFDRRNFHLFQQLMYQVATASLSPRREQAHLKGFAEPVPFLRIRPD